MWFGDAMVRSGRERVYEDMGEPVLFGAMSACFTRADWGCRKNRFGLCREQERKSQDDGSHQAREAHSPASAPPKENSAVAQHKAGRYEENPPPQEIA